LPPHPGTCKVFPTDVGADIDAGIDGVRVLTLDDCLLLVRQLGRIFLGRREGREVGLLWDPHSPSPQPQVSTPLAGGTPTREIELPRPGLKSSSLGDKLQAAAEVRPLWAPYNSRSYGNTSLLFPIQASRSEHTGVRLTFFKESLKIHLRYLKM
jgi:hypothetical protein